MRSAVFGLTLVVVGGAMGQTSADPVSQIASEIRGRHFDRAVELAEAALADRPKDVRILTMEAIALAGLGKDQKALAAYHKALEISPNYVAALAGAAELEYKSGSEAAVPLLDRLLKLQPENGTAHGMRAAMAWKAKDCATAVVHFGLAGDAISSKTEALQEYGACLVRLGRPGDAAPVFRRLVALDPNDRRARYRLAAAQLMAKSFADAIETLQPDLEGQAPDPEALDLAASAWEELGDTPRAVAALRQAIVLAPDNPKFYVDFASLSLIHKSFQVGVDMVDAGLKRLPEAAPLYIARGVLNVQLARYDEADSDFASAERLDPREAYGGVARGLAQVQQNDFEKALVTVREKLKARRNDEYLYYLLAEILSSQGAQPGSAEFKEAVAAASRAVALKPDFALARDVLSRLYLAAGDIDHAIEQCRLALRDNPLDATALYRLIRALQKSDRPGAADEAKSLLQRFNQVREELSKQEAAESRYKLVEAAPGQDKR